ncbi:hypothetical protein CVT24_009899 [Panaeolus cyanescens]|uniref:DNA 3'-5' helicase n=1 Tax=Panaeolus cyanescens TaxID=181874 RepID=A0A409WS29_9AGAR|nr:hypothetical protein CVT24_009899 [Panaeolus cyanescens]
MDSDHETPHTNTASLEGPATLQERLKKLREMSLTSLEELVLVLGSDFEARLPRNYLMSLDDKDREICLRACLVCYSVTGASQVPRQMQLQVVISNQHGKDCLVSAGTGSGKTLPIALNILLDDDSKQTVTITFSPLKRLQVTQENDFITRYSIPTVVINEDTPNDDAWWNKNICDIKNRKMGWARHLIVTVEQKVIRVNIDEAHNIYTAGLALYGRDAFRPAWGRLDEIKAILSNSCSWTAYSATLPPHVLKLAAQKLMRLGYQSVHVTSNRPNTTYVLHQVPDSINDVRLYECFINLKQDLFDATHQPHVLIFVDDKNLCTKIAHHLVSKLPSSYNNDRFAMHYHSQMSEAYLRLAYDEFTQPHGKCFILVTTSSNSVGVDFPNVSIVCQVGFPGSVMDLLQRAGRAARNTAEPAMFIVFYERWVKDMPRGSFQYGDQSDPDRPQGSLKLQSQRRERIPYSCVNLVKNEALLYSTDFCCNGPKCSELNERTFNLQSCLPGTLHDPASELSPPGAAKDKSPTEARQYRPTKERPGLEARLNKWLLQEHAQDPLRCVRPIHMVLSHSQRHELVRADPSKIKSPSDVTALLKETKEWAMEWEVKVFAVIETFKKDFNRFLHSFSSQPASATTATQTRVQKLVIKIPARRLQV